MVLLLLLVLSPAMAGEDASAIVKGAIDHWRGSSSFGEMTMIIHRPDWERTMSMRAWTQGEKRSLVRITEPRKDRGNGTLMDDNNMWMFSPKVNRVIKVPSSMMNQSWMGSDFSNKDISRADDIIDQYEHSLLSRSESDDHILLEHGFYDQDGILVKSLTSLEIAEMGGRVVATRQRMAKVDAPDEWTEIRIDSIEYDVELSDSVFTLSNLRNPRN